MRKKSDRSCRLRHLRPERHVLGRWNTPFTAVVAGEGGQRKLKQFEVLEILQERLRPLRFLGDVRQR